MENTDFISQAPNSTQKSSLNLSTKITLCFAVIGLMYLGVLSYVVKNGVYVSDGLSIMNNESSPVVRLSAEVDGLVRDIEPVMLELIASKSTIEFEHHVSTLHRIYQDMDTALGNRQQTLPQMQASVESAFVDLATKIVDLKQNDADIIAQQTRIVELIEATQSKLSTLNELQTQVTPLLQETLLLLDEEATISVVNSIDASITYGLWLIERIGNASNTKDISRLQDEFVAWQNRHSTLLPALIFSSNDRQYQNFVSRLSSLTLSLLNAVEGDQGLLAIQTDKLALIAERSMLFATLKSKLSEVSNITGQLVKDSFERNESLSEQINKRADEQNRASIIIGAIMAIAIILISIWITRFIRRSIQKLSKQLSAVSKGILRTIPPAQANDEFGRLNDYLSQVTQNLKQTIQDINHSSHEVEKSVQTVAQTASSTRSIVSQQKYELDSVATALLEMSTTAQEVAKYTEETHSKVIQASELSTTGRDRVRDSKTSVDQVAAQTQQTISVISKLDEGVKSIESIIDTITNIAEQTNLLALNAAIEAARAGEQGRGFAVVADEVRTLANRTQSATLEIQQKINAMIEESQTAVEVSSQSEALVSTSLQHATTADEAIDELEKIMTKIQDLSHLISTAAEQQAATLTELDRNLNKITVLADQTNAESETSEKAALSQVEIVQELENKVSKFTIES